MTARLRRHLAKVLVCALVTASAATANAQIGVTKSQARWIVVGIAAIGAGIGLGIYFAIHHGHSIKGCAASGPDGLQLQNQGDQKTYALVGETASIKPGERVRVSGKKAKTASGGSPQFIVEKFNRDYGSCGVSPAAP